MQICGDTLGLSVGDRTLDVFLCTVLLQHCSTHYCCSGTGGGG